MTGGEPAVDRPPVALVDSWVEREEARVKMLRESAMERSINRAAFYGWDEPDIVARAAEWREMWGLIAEQEADEEKARARAEAERKIQPFVTVWPGARMFRVSIPKGLKGKRKKRPRGDQFGFSERSRKGMLDTIAQIDRQAGKPVFVTLTYPVPPANCDAAREDFRTFEKRLVRRYPGASCLWRLEIQPSRLEKRGEVGHHFHLMIFGVNGYIPIEWLETSWQETIGQINESRNSVDVERIRTWRGVMFYVAKYCAKRDDALEGMATTDGRVWGVTNRECWPGVEPVEVEIDYPAAFAVRKFVDEELAWRRGGDDAVKALTGLFPASRLYDECPEALLEIVGNEANTNNKHQLNALLYITYSRRRLTGVDNQHYGNDKCGNSGGGEGIKKRGLGDVKPVDRFSFKGPRFCMPDKGEVQKDGPLVPDREKGGGKVRCDVPGRVAGQGGVVEGSGRNGPAAKMGELAGVSAHGSIVVGEDGE